MPPHPTGCPGKRQPEDFARAPVSLNYRGRDGPVFSRACGSRRPRRTPGGLLPSLAIVPLAARSIRWRIQTWQRKPLPRRKPKTRQGLPASRLREVGQDAEQTTERAGPAGPARGTQSGSHFGSTPRIFRPVSTISRCSSQTFCPVCRLRQVAGLEHPARAKSHFAAPYARLDCSRADRLPFCLELADSAIQNSTGEATKIEL